MHTWKFFRLGGFDHVAIQSAEDLIQLPTLDPKLWAVLSSPAKGMEFDAATLAFLDADKDGRVRLFEVQSALRWVTSLLADPTVLLQHSEAVSLAQIRTDLPEGRELLHTAQHVLSVLAGGEKAEISLDDVMQAANAVRKSPLNGDGVVTPASTPDATLAAAIADITTVTGGAPDACGEQGVSAEHVKAFFAELRALAAWQANPVTADGGIATVAAPDAHAAFRAVAAKIDDYFTRCGVADFDPDSRALLNDFESSYTVLAADTISPGTSALAALPLARVEADAALPLAKGLNPAWRAAMATFVERVVAPTLGDKTVLTETEWQMLKQTFAGFSAWIDAKPAAQVEKLDAARLADLLAGDFEAQLLALIAQDEAVREHVERLAALEKLLRFVRHLDIFLRNFASLEAFYTPNQRAIFQAGTLYIDGRSCNLCIKVDAVAKHATIAGLSRTYLLYCDCVKRGGAEKMSIVAAVTVGDSANLMPGRNGIFVDRAGEEWDATVVHIVDNPISIRQAVWSPYQRAGRLINEQIQKFAGAREKKVADTTASGIEAAKVPDQPFDIAKFAGIFAAVGLAVGALGTAVAALLTGFLSLTWWQMPLALVGFFAVVSGPSAILAWFKLRERNLAPILDASGWAINTKAKINLLFGATLTAAAKLPPGSTVRLTDPFVDEAGAKRRKRILWAFGLLAAVLLALYANQALKHLSAPVQPVQPAPAAEPAP
jgi:hypothetical protein